jgi:hypothetical protein
VGKRNFPIFALDLEEGILPSVEMNLEDERLI